MTCGIYTKHGLCAPPSHMNPRHMLQHISSQEDWIYNGEHHMAFGMPSRDDDSYLYDDDAGGNGTYGATPYSSSGRDFKWHDGLYFTVVTLSTVGYGDMSPDHPGVQYLVIFFILFCVIYIPMKIGRIQGVF